MKILKYTIALILTIVITSCADFLETSPHDSVSDDLFWQNSEDALVGLSSIYSDLYNGYFAFSTNSSSNDKRILMDGLTDNLYSGNAYGISDFITGQHTPSSGGIITGYYSACFNIITKVNMFISKLTLVENMDAGLKNQYEAEAKFLRAFAYFELSLMYGDVPLFENEPVIEDANVGRSPVSEVMKLVNQDIDFAIANLPDSEYYDGHVVKNSALALKARICLFEKDYIGVVEYSDQVISSGKTVLYPDYRSMFYDGQGADNTEILFSVKYLHPDRSHITTYQLGTWFAFDVLEDLVNDYYTINGLPINEDPIYNPEALWLNRDPRLRESVFCEPGEPFLYEPENGYQYYFLGSTTKYRMKKFANITEQPAYDDNDFILIRYADVLLMHAEALNELGQFSENDWDKTIRPIRQRAGFTAESALNFPGGSQSQLRDEIRHERRIELAFEGIRYYDLIRWDLLGEAWGNIEGENPQERTFNTQKGYLWPIPQNQIDYYENNNIEFPQNPGY